MQSQEHKKLSETELRWSLISKWLIMNLGVQQQEAINSLKKVWL